MWAFRISQDAEKRIDTLRFTNTANVHPLPFAARFEPRQDAEQMKRLLRE
jgi:hypothetical protein